MAARNKKIRHDDETRAKIQAAQIINRFHACIMGEVTLDSQQVSCGKTLLAKVLPDLSSAEMTSEVTHTYVARMPASTETVNEWERQHSPKAKPQTTIQ